MAIVLTERAARMVADVMNESGLEPKRHSLDVQPSDEGLKLGFSLDAVGAQLQHGVLVCQTDADILIDVHQEDGRWGLIFREGNR